MGRKVHPIGFRLGYIKDWQSKWFADRTYTRPAARRHRSASDLTRELANAGVARVEIERSANKIEVTVFTAKPGIVIGKRGAKVDELKAELEKRTGKKVKLNIQEIHQPELEAQLVAESIAEQINKRISYQARNEAGRAARDATWCPGRQDQVLGSARWRGDGAYRQRERWPGAAPYAARRYRLRPSSRTYDLWPHWREGLDLQGRSLPRCGAIEATGRSNGHVRPQQQERSAPAPAQRWSQ